MLKRVEKSQKKLQVDKKGENSNTEIDGLN